MVIKNVTKAKLITIVCLILNFIARGQSLDTVPVISTTPNYNARLTGLIIGGTAIYAGSMYGLYQMWYKDYPQTTFHFINDNHEWQQLDKGGHMFNAYYMGKIGYESLRWAGVNKRKSAIYGGGLGFIYLTVIEVLDGFSAEWGASGGDLLANTLGSTTFISQQLLWDEQRIQIKWSVHLTDYSQYRPEQLGHSFAERMIKDYNGQVFWLSANISSFLKEESRFPKWLQIAAGYGGEGMTGGIANPVNIDGKPLPSFDRYRKFYIAPDINLSKINTGSKVLNTCLKYLSIFKFPMPALEFSKKGVKVHPLYF